jgi:regulator of replication initiation timing
VDISAVAGKPVYAIGDGYIKAHYTNLGSYCTFILDGSPIKVFYVHTYKWIASGKKVKKGEVICYVAPTSLNGGYPTHLHLGLALGYNLIDYMARDNKFATKYADIKKSWFNADGTFNWSLHKDLDYKTNKPVPPPEPPIPEPTECEKRVQILEDSLDALTGDYRTLQDQYLKLSDEAKIMIAENVELHIQLKEMNEKYGTLMIERNTLKNENAQLIDKVNQGTGMYTTGELFSELWKRLFARK